MTHLPRLEWEVRDGRLWLPRWHKWAAVVLCGLAVRALAGVIARLAEPF